jgi:hypothetical protein
MEAKDFRIGNLVIYNGDRTNPNQDCKLDGNDIYLMEDNDDYLDAHEPIPFTKDLIFKIKDLAIDSEYSQTRIEFTKDSNKDGTYYAQLKDTDDGWIGRKLYYLHDLQNLWHSLTGNELPIK